MFTDLYKTSSCKKAVRANATHNWYDHKVTKFLSQTVTRTELGAQVYIYLKITNTIDHNQSRLFRLHFTGFKKCHNNCKYNDNLFDDLPTTIIYYIILHKVLNKIDI